MDKLQLSKSFNGVAAAAPEVGLVLAASGGVATASLQTLAMSDSKRNVLAAELESSIKLDGMQEWACTTPNFC